MSSEYDGTARAFSCAYPWLFPGGVGDIWDPKRCSINDIDGPVNNLRSWANHLMHYYDGRFQKDQMFGLYVYNRIQRQENNRDGSYFHSDENWFGKKNPTLEEMKTQIRNGDFTFVSKLRYIASKIKGTDGFWRGKAHELRSWIDYHVANQNGPPTHFITLTCAENWWPDLQDIYADIEEMAGRHSEASLLRTGDSKAMGRAARRNPMYVNQYFMFRAKRFLDTFAYDVLELEHYWGRVEFAPGRGAIHLHLLGIAKNKAYLPDFYKAKTEREKVKVVEDYAKDVLGMTADVKIDENHHKFGHNEGESFAVNISPLGRRFSEAKDVVLDHIHLAQDCILHHCSEYCLGKVDKAGLKLRTCKFGCGTEQTPNQADTPGRELIQEAKIDCNSKGVENLLLPRYHSRRINQHSQYVLQGWRANADVQLIIYRSNPEVPHVSEIEAVTRYCTSYASKGHQTTQHEINTVQSVITG